MDVLISLSLVVVVFISMSLFAVICLYVIINAFKFFKALFTTMPRSGYKKRFKEKLSLNIITFLPKKSFIQLFIAMAVINSGLYLMSRHSWIDNDDAKNIKAKHYMVAGDVLSRQLGFVTFFIHPDSYKLKPLFWLQKGIYLLGEKHLSNNDGEKAMWYYRFFIYPYSQKSILPYSNLWMNPYWSYIPRSVARGLLELPLLGKMVTRGIPPNTKAYKDYRKPQQEFLSKTFEILKTISTQPIADANMHRAYLQAYPGFAFYYSIKQGYRYNGHQGSRTINLYKEPWYIPHNKEQLSWYLKFEKKFEEESIKKLYGKKLDKNRVLLYGALLNILEDFIKTDMKTFVFTCKGEHIQDYVRVRNLLVGEDANKADLMYSQNFKQLKRVNESQKEKGGVLYRLSRGEINSIYDGFIQMPASFLYKYIARDICGYKVYGKSVWKSDRGFAERSYGRLMKEVKNIKNKVNIK